MAIFGPRNAQGYTTSCRPWRSQARDSPEYTETSCLDRRFCGLGECVQPGSVANPCQWWLRSWGKLFLPLIRYGMAHLWMKKGKDICNPNLHMGRQCYSAKSDGREQKLIFSWPGDRRRSRLLIVSIRVLPVFEVSATAE